MAIYELDVEVRYTGTVSIEADSIVDAQEIFDDAVPSDLAIRSLDVYLDYEMSITEESK